MNPRNWLPSSRTRKAVATALVVVAAYLVGIFPADASLLEGFARMTGVQWLGLVLFVGGAYGITYAVPNAQHPAGRGEGGFLRLTSSSWPVWTGSETSSTAHGPSRDRTLPGKRRIRARRAG